MIIMKDQDKDIIGEVMNISMGAGANALAILLMKTCYITTPNVTVINREELSNSPEDDCMLVKIRFTKGVDGMNLFSLKKKDMSVIMGTMMGMEMEIEEFDEMSSSAACEIMNQMMGSSATALSQFFDTVVDISTPESYVVKERSGLQQYFDLDDDVIVCVEFKLMIRNTLETTFKVYLDQSIADKLVEKCKR